MKAIVTLFFTILFTALTLAQSSGLQFLEVGPTAAELSISEAAVATPNGSASMYVNPALLVMQDRPSLSIGYTSWIADTDNLFGGINLKKGNRAVAFSFYTSGISGFEQRNNPGDSNGEFSIQYVSISGAYAREFKFFSAGIAAHYLNEEVYPFRANGYAVNLGLATTLLDEKIRIGTSLINLGEMEKLDLVATELPSSFNFGLAVDILEFVHGKSPDLPILTTLMADFVQPLESLSTDDQDFTPTDTYFNLGISLLISEVVEIRAGYKTQDNVRPTSFGLGFITDKVRFNYALIPFNTGFGTVHSIGLQYQL